MGSSLPFRCTLQCCLTQPLLCRSLHTKPYTPKPIHQAEPHVPSWDLILRNVEQLRCQSSPREWRMLKTLWLERCKSRHILRCRSACESWGFTGYGEHTPESMSWGIHLTLQMEGKCWCLNAHPSLQSVPCRSPKTTSSPAPFPWHCHSQLAEGTSPAAPSSLPAAQPRQPSVASGQHFLPPLNRSIIHLCFHRPAGQGIRQESLLTWLI